MKILLVEDNIELGENIKEYLEIEGYEVLVAKDGEEGIDMFDRNLVDLILLDRMLPKKNGLEVCDHIKFVTNTPVIMVTAKTMLDDKLEGFDCGADDYITKPFDMKELVARIKAISKRVNLEDILQIKDIKINLAKKIVFKGDKEIDLTLKEFRILKLLVKNRGVAISRTDIIQEVWGEDGMFDDKADGKLDVYISKLRSKLDKKLIETVRGYGYKIH